MRLNYDNGEISSLFRRGFLLILPLALTACDAPKVAQESARPVKAMIVEPAVKERVLTYSGTLAPRIDSTLGFRVQGKIVERYVNLGDGVTKGQQIARLDETDLKLAENSARANLASAKTRLAVANDALSRAQFLLPKGFIAQSVVDQRQLEADAAQAAYKSAGDQLNEASNATGYALLAADQDGVVTSVRAEPGQVVSAGQPVITLAHGGEVEASVTIPEQDIALLKVGDPADVALWAVPAEHTQGKIREIAGAADPALRTYGARLSIPSPSPGMRLGMTATVSFHLPQLPMVVVPLAAFTEKDGKTIAFVVSRDGDAVSERAVTLAGVTEVGAKVAAGIAPGEIVVTGGVQFLRDGMRVRLPKDVLPAVAEAAPAR
jgi:RND family efflux transporter MFP subunit